MVSPIVLAIAAFVIPIPFIYISGQVQRYQIRNEIFEYVIENKDEIELENPALRQEFYYKPTGLSISGVEYGYVYNPRNDFSYGGEKYPDLLRSGGAAGGHTVAGAGADAGVPHTDEIPFPHFFPEPHDGAGGFGGAYMAGAF